MGAAVILLSIEGLLPLRAQAIIPPLLILQYYML